MARIRSVLTGAALALTLGLGGCTDDDPAPAPGPTDSPTVSGSPSDSPTVSASPTAPALGPEGTVEAWVNAQNDAFANGDTADMKNFYATECRGCSNFTDPIEEVYGAGGHYSTSGWVLDARKVRDPNARPVVVNAAVTIPAGETVLAAGEEPVKYEADKRIMVFRLRPADAGWLIAFIGFLS